MPTILNDAFINACRKQIERTLKRSLTFLGQRMSNRHRFLEGEEGGGGEGEGKGGGGTGVQDPPQTFTQEQVDKMIGDRLGKVTSEKKKLVGQLEALQQSQNLTQQERDTLQGQIDELNTSMLTKDEQAAKQLADAQKKHQQALEGANQERDVWKTRFHQSTIRRSLTDAAVETEAVSPQQLQMMYEGATELVEVKDEAGKGTGTFVPHLTFLGLEEGADTPSEMKLPVAEAITKLKADGLNANLFKHGATGGTGEPPNSGGTGGRKTKFKEGDNPPSPDDYTSSNDYESAYDQWADANGM